MEHDSAPYASFRTSTSSSDTPNPLRPYYVPPSIGLPPDPAPQPQGNTGRYTSRPTTPPRPKGSQLRSSARDYLPNLDYADYLPERSPSVTESVKCLVDQAVWNYTSVFLAQPFEVAKTVLQCHLAAGEPQRGGSGGYASAGGSDYRPRGGGRRHGFPDVRPRTSRRGSPILVRLDTDHGRRLTCDQQDSYCDVEEDDRSDESDSDSSPSYFTSAAPPSAYASAAYSTPPSRSQHHPQNRRQPRRPPSRSHSTTPTPGSMPQLRKDTKIALRRPDAVLDVIAQLWQKEAAWGVWKGTNATFVYNILLRTLESWIRSLLAAVMNLPEAVPAAVSSGAAGLASSSSGSGGSGADILDSPNPMASLGVAVAAAGLTALVLSPLDTVRTRLIITPTSSSPRAILPSLRLLPAFSTLQSHLAPSTLLHSTVPSLVTNAAPLLLRSLFRIDPVLTPTLYSLASFAAALAELFVRLPLETVLRRGQAALLHTHAAALARSTLPRSTAAASSSDDASEFESVPAPPPRRKLDTIVDVGPYRGVLGSMWFIVREEGASPADASSRAAVAAKGRTTPAPRARKGQGLPGLWRGWRVGFWGLVGVWGAAALGGGGAGGEF